MINKLKTVGWYLQQPKGLQLVFNLLKQRTIYKAKEHTQTDAENWCAAHAIDTVTALKKLFPGQQILFKEVAYLFPEDFNYAHKKMDTTPYKMGGAGNMNFLYNVCELLQAKYVAETGVAYGWSSLSILLSLQKRSGHLFSTDMPYAKMGNENYVGIVVPPTLKNYWTLIQEADISGMPKLLKQVEYLDVIHYDSDKSYVGRMTTYPSLYKKLRKGGVFISDDIQDNLGFKIFCDKIGITPTVIYFDEKYVGAFVK